MTTEDKASLANIFIIARRAHVSDRAQLIEVLRLEDEVFKLIKDEPNINDNGGSDQDGNVDRG